MRNILLTVQFDGTDFVGWQYQPGLRSAQGVLRDALESMVQHPVTVFGSSRTDSGVHARALPANFETPRDIPLHGFLKGLNTALPNDIGIVSVEQRPLGWRTRYESVAKTYVYRFIMGHGRWPLYERTAWRCRWESLDLDAMNEAACRLLGEQDFSAFRSSNCVSQTTHRCIYAASVRAAKNEPIVEFEITGNAFLHNMVRILAGTLAEVGRGRMAPAQVTEALASGERAHAGPTAPANGLTLWRVFFDGYPKIGKANH